MKKTVPLLLLFITTMTLSLLGCATAGRAGAYDIVVYGGSFAGCAAGVTAAATAPDRSVLVVVPDPVHRLGGIGTTGGQNFFDIRRWQGDLPTKGSFEGWFKQSGQFYDTDAMAALLRADLAKHRNLTLLWAHDIEKITLDRGKISSPSSIKGLELREIYRDSRGKVVWGAGSRAIRGKVFVDASEDGKLTRLAGGNVTNGRRDWPAAYLPPDEEGEQGLPRQQAATLMFKVTGLELPPAPLNTGDLIFTRDQRGNWGIIGGLKAFQDDPVVTVFNDTYGPLGYALKPLNAAQNGPGSDQWWINALVVFNVDGRAHQRDAGSERYPADAREDHRDVDTAWTQARNFLNNPDLIKALRQLSHEDSATGKRYGFHNASLVRDSLGQPVVGDVLYLRETVHSPLNPVLEGNDTENSNYALTSLECQGAGSGPDNGSDTDNYPHRIGLGYYAMDINAFAHGDLKFSEQYVWPVTAYLRPDWQSRGGEPQNPVYLPYEMLINSRVSNLLSPGYATGASSFAWAEIRVIPNLCVLGDAAGAAAARAVLHGENPADFGEEQIRWVQEELKKLGARLEK